jgi:RNA polymerase sigma-70 factor, ECF subfamily
VFDTYYAPLSIYSTCIVGDSDEAEEIVEQLFYTIWKNHKELPLLRSLNAYLYGAVRNQSLQYLSHKNIQQTFAKKSKAGNELEIHEIDPQKQMEINELESLVNATIDELPERRRVIFRMHRFEGVKYDEIASQLQISVKTVEAEMTKALKAMREQIGNYYHS